MTRETVWVCNRCKAEDRRPIGHPQSWVYMEIFEHGKEHGAKFDLCPTCTGALMVFANIQG